MTNFSILCPNDELIQRVVPYYAQMVDLMVRILSSGPQPETILDLGAGPGRISEVILKSLPDATLTLLDASEGILKIAEKRLAAANPALIVGDFTEADLGGPYDAIVAGLTLHHLSDDEKQQMIHRLREVLAPGGLLVVSDIVLGSTPAWDHYYEQVWLDHISDLPSEQHANVARHYHEEDHPARLEDQLQWLQDDDFEEVACHWRNLNFAVFSGRKTS